MKFPGCRLGVSPFCATSCLKIPTLKKVKMTEEKKMKVEFAPGCFDHFEGTQEELDEMIAEIMRMAESGELAQNSTVMTEEEFNELPDEVKAQLMSFGDDEDDFDIPEEFKRRLQ